MYTKVIFIFIIIVLFILLKKSNCLSNYLLKIEKFCSCGTTIAENKEGFCSNGCVENFQGFSKNLNENFCPGEFKGKRYSTKYLYTQPYNISTPTLNSLQEPYYITNRYN
jgi:hypothetical protein